MTETMPARGAMGALVVSAVVNLVCSQQVLADDQTQSQSHKEHFEIRSQSFTGALQAYARQTGEQVVFFSDVGAGRMVQHISGTYTREEVLERILANTRLTYQRLNGNTVAVGPAARPDSKDLQTPQSPSTEKDTSMTPAHSLLCCSATALAMLSIGPRAMAQDSQAGDALSITEVLVTATRREESAQKAPVTVVALDSEKLAQDGVNGITGLTGEVPNLNVDANGMIFLRGIGSTDTREEGDPTTAAYMDGVYLAPYWAERALGFYDVERVEVLEGPQGTLFGRNSTAGAINFITRQPKLGVTEGSASVSVGNYQSLLATGVLNIPLGQTIALRAAFESDTHDFYEPSRQISNAGFNNADRKAGRVSVKWTPNEALTVLLRGDFEQDDSLPGNFATGYTTNGHPTDFHSDIAFQGTNHSHYGGLSVEADWRVGPGTLTALVSDRTSNFNYITAYQILNQTPMKQHIDGNVQQGELRYAGISGNFKYVVGLFHFHEVLDPVDASFPDVFTFTTPADAGINAYEFIEKEDSNAAYGQVTYSITSRFRVTGGLRYSDDSKFRTGQGGEVFFPTGSYLVNPTQFPSNPAIILGPYSPVTVPGIPNYADISWKKTDWKAGFEYDLGRDSFVYANASTGFKDGGYNDAITPNKNLTFNPEVIREYEIGSKNQFLDHKLQINGDIFYYNYSQLQVSGVSFIPYAAPQAITFNSGRARSLGADLSLIAAPTSKDRLDFSLGLLSAKYTNFDLPLGDAFHTGAVSYSGNPLQSAPRYTATLGYAHRFELGQSGALTPHLQTRYTGHQSMNYTNFAVAQQGGYSKTDLTLTYNPHQGSWWLQGYVRNIENRVVYSYVQPNSLTSAGYSLADPRTWGMSVNVSF